MTVLKPSMVRYFFLSLKRGSFDDPVTRRALIATFVNKIYLYDDKLTIHLNTGGNPVEITGKIIEEVEESNAEAECSFKGRSAPPEKASLSTCFFLLSVPCGTISAPSLREVCFASEVPAGVGGTLNFSLCASTKLH